MLDLGWKVGQWAESGNAGGGGVRSHFFAQEGQRGVGRARMRGKLCELRVRGVFLAKRKRKRRMVGFLG